MLLSTILKPQLDDTTYGRTITILRKVILNTIVINNKLLVNNECNGYYMVIQYGISVYNINNGNTITHMVDDIIIIA